MDKNLVHSTSPEEKTHQCPVCHRKNALSSSEADEPGFVCDICYAKDIGRSMDEGFGGNFSHTLLPTPRELEDK